MALLAVVALEREVRLLDGLRERRIGGARVRLAIGLHVGPREERAERAEPERSGERGEGDEETAHQHRDRAGGLLAAPLREEVECSAHHVAAVERQHAARD